MEFEYQIQWLIFCLQSVCTDYKSRDKNCNVSVYPSWDHTEGSCDRFHIWLSAVFIFPGRWTVCYIAKTLAGLCFQTFLYFARAIRTCNHYICIIQCNLTSMHTFCFILINVMLWLILSTWFRLPGPSSSEAAPKHISKSIIWQPGCWSYSHDIERHHITWPTYQAIICTSIDSPAGE